MKCLPSSNVKLILKNANARYTVTFLQFFVPYLKPNMPGY